MKRGKTPKHGLRICTLVVILFLSVTAASGDQLYDLCMEGHLLRGGSFLFIRHKYSTLDPVLKTMEIHLFNPQTGKITFLQRGDEKVYHRPVVSADRSTVVYHSVIEGNDFLVTRNLQSDVSTRLRFDTGGYFLLNALHYDNDTVASVLKRGEGRQAIYIISNSRGTISRIFNVRDIRDMGFLSNGNIYYADMLTDRVVLGIVKRGARGSTIVARGVERLAKAPEGNALLYSTEDGLFFYRVNNEESIKLLNEVPPDLPFPLMAEDGSTCVVFRHDAVLIVNIPSGDVLYLLALDTKNTSHILTNFTLYTAKGNSIFHIKHKKPGQYLVELLKEKEPVTLLGASPDDRYLFYQTGDPSKLIIYTIESGRRVVRDFPFAIQDIYVPESPTETLYIRGTSRSDDQIELRELYLYNFKIGGLVAISAASNTDLGPYLREVEDLDPVLYE